MKIKTRTGSNLEKVLSVRKLCFFLNNKFRVLMKNFTLNVWLQEQCELLYSEV